MTMIERRYGTSCFHQLHVSTAYRGGLTRTGVEDAHNARFEILPAGNAWQRPRSSL